MRLINILGIKINVFTKKQALVKIEKLLAGEGQHYLVTPNPEIILQATSHDEEFFYILNQADLALPDGIGLKIAAWFMGVNLPRVTGADLVKDILELAQSQGRRVAVFNWQGGLSSEPDIRQALADKYPGLPAIVIGIDRQAVIPEQQLALAGEFQPEIIFSCLGAPWQEKFIFHNLAKLPSVKIGVGVGGALDFLSGRIQRAPKLFIAIGLEWLWRLIQQPWRWQRIYNAVIIFPTKFFLWRFILPFLYRASVVCLLYKKEQGIGGKVKYKILIVERANEKNHWQLPQGGTDGENLMTAGRRELSEELNNDKFKSAAVFSKLHVYEFGDQMSKFGVEAKTARGYRGQKQGLFIAKFLGQDQNIKVNFWEYSAWRWVEAEKLVAAVHPVRRASARIFMDKFWQLVKK
jgi:N-acetylglucosaminyldiphosphoundecaprenol N-acetyl-beta-D-mannosaminyltransferase